MVTYEYPPVGGGLGKAVRETGLELARRGHSVTVLTSRFAGQPRASHDGPLRIVRIPVLRRHLHYAHAAEVLSFAASGLVFAHHRLGPTSPDVILAYLTVPSGIVGLWLAHACGAPLLTLLRGTDVPGHAEIAPWMHALAGPVTRLIWRRSHAVVSNSTAMARQAERSLKGLHAAVVHNGIDLGRYRPAGSGDRGAGPVRVLYAGRLVKVKRLDVLLHAWAGVHARAPEARLELAGFGPERPALEALAGRLGIASSVEFLGRLDEGAMVDRYQRSDVFISISRDEGQPNAVLEAMACGLPVLLSSIGPHEEILADSGAGLTCDGDNGSAVEAGLLALIQDPEKRKVMGRAAHRRIESAFGWDRTAAGLEALFP